MKINSAEAYLVDLEPETPRVDAIQSFVKQETIFVDLTTDDGGDGTGYAYTIGTGGRAVLQLLREDLLGRLLGQDARRVEAIWQDLFWSTHGTVVGAITSLALAAVDTALWDLRCRRAGLPLHVMAGGAQRGVPVYTTEGGWLQLETAALVEDAVRAKESGFGGCKLKVGRPAHEDAARLAAVREAVGAGFEIMVDANQAFTWGDAVRRARLYEPFDLAWFEEPLPADDIDGHVELARRTTLPIAIGESLYGLGHFRDYLQRGACSVVQMDVARIGGITPWLKVAHLAEAYNLPVCPHFLMELHVALAAAVPNGRWVEHIPQLDAITESGMRIENGRAVPSDAPGLGIAWDFPAIEAMTVPGTSTELRL